MWSESRVLLGALLCEVTCDDLKVKNFRQELD